VTGLGHRPPPTGAGSAGWAEPAIHADAGRQLTVTRLPASIPSAAARSVAVNSPPVNGVIVDAAAAALPAGA
jgi:hypothetical protein